ncbi:hypothetical protein ABBQ38_013409 [Trebouxia sp. C0009 RCD-2024]
MQSVVTTSARCKFSSGLQPSPPSVVVIPGRPCLRSGCRVLSSTASLSTWQSTKQFTLVHAPEKRGSSCRQVTRMGNKSTSGPFVPIVKLTRAAIGNKQFNQLRGKGISLHSQVIKSFGQRIGADNKQVQGLVRLAKKNGEKLGFLA